MRFIESLDNDTIKLLRTIHKKSKFYRTRQRALCILLSHQRYTPTQLAKMFGVDRETIYNWLNAFKQRKLAGLYDKKGKGRKPKLSADQQRQVKKWIKQWPNNLKKVAAKVKEKFGISISPKTIKQIVKKLGFTFRRIRKTPSKEPDKQIYDQKKQELEELKKEHKEGKIELAYVDESGFSLEPSIAYAWQMKGQTIEIRGKKSKRLNVVGILTKDGKLFSYTFEGSIDTTVVVACISEFAKKMTKPTVLVIDNAKIHTSEEFEAKVEQWQSVGLSIFYLPTYSPHLNPIEMVWKFMKYIWIEFWAYLSWDKLVEYVEHVLANFGEQYQINFG